MDAALGLAREKGTFVLIYWGNINGCTLCKKAMNGVFNTNEFYDWATRNNIPLVYGDYIIDKQKGVYSTIRANYSPGSSFPVIIFATGSKEKIKNILYRKSQGHQLTFDYFLSIVPSREQWIGGGVWEEIIEVEEVEECFIYYEDKDDDGWGAGEGKEFCGKPPGGYSRRSGDCNDNDPKINPGAVEECDGVDNNCNGEEDEIFECKKGSQNCTSSCSFQTRTKPCKGTLPNNAVLSKGDLNYLEKWDGEKWVVSWKDTFYFDSRAKDCAFICEENHYYEQGECKPFSCLKGDINYELVNECVGSNEGITQRNIRDKIVDECSNERKCEYVCKEGTYLGINEEGKRTCLEREYKCEGEIDANAEIFFGDDEGLTQNISRVLSKTNTQRKCEYFCTNNTILDEILNKCVPNTFVCLGKELIDGNAVIYENDDIDLGANLESILVDTNTQRKCEYHCLTGFHKGSGVDENKCIPNEYYCVGEMDVNARMCKDSDLDLDQNTTSILSRACTGKKCEWICGEGLERGTGTNSNKCVPKSEFECMGEMDTTKMELYEGDDEGLTQFDNLINTLVFENTEMKCEWKCREGYYLVGVEGKGYDCVKESEEIFQCTGRDPPNSIMYASDDKGLTRDTPKTLSPFNTQKKCEYGCAPGYYLGVVEEETICLPRTFSCFGSIPNGVLYIGDDVGLTQDLNVVLVEENTQRKCEMHCALNFEKDGNVCVRVETSLGVCGNAEKAFTPNEEFPGSFVLCEEGTPFPTNPFLSNEIGSITEWVCMLDENKNCSATRVSSKYELPVINQPEKNSIIKATTKIKEDGKIELTLKCEKTTVVEIKIKNYEDNSIIDLEKKTFDCTTEEKKHELNPIKKTLPLTQKIFQINTAIKDKDTCEECEFSYFMDYTPLVTQEESPLFFIIIGLVIIGIIGVIGFIAYQKFGSKKEFTPNEIE